MAAIDRFILLVRDLRRNQCGIAVPTALMALVASFALASVAVISTVDVQQGTHRDHEAKEAIAAADAGANIALLRLNRYLPYISTTHPCVGPKGEYQTATSGWCPATTAEKVGNASYSYMISAYPASGTINVVAVGTSGTVSRRVNVAMKAVSGKNVFANEKVLGQETITLGGNVRIETDIGTNGTIESNGTPTICGNDRHGVGKEAPTPSCSGEKTEENKNLPGITPPTNIETENDNCRLTKTCASAEQVDVYSKKNSLPFSTTTRVLKIDSSQQLTMGGSVYLVCKLEIQGKLYIPAGVRPQIYVAAPESKFCPSVKSGETQVEIGAAGVIESSGFNPGQGTYEVPSIFVLGNGAVKIDGTPKTTDEVMLYAPYSEIEMKGNATWNGMIAGKKLNINGNVTITSNPNIQPPEITLASTFQRTQYVECVGATASPPNANC